MANISNAHGTIELRGGWTQEDIDLLSPVAKTWASWYYRLELDGPLSPEQKKQTFFGLGRWSFFGTLDSLHQWTLHEIEKPQHQLNLNSYQALLDRMKEKGLRLFLDYEDTLEEGDVLHENGFLSSDGQKLLYKQGPLSGPKTASNLISVKWSQFGPECLEDAVQLFAKFLSAPDMEAVKEWVLTIEPLFPMYESFALKQIYVHMCQDYTDAYVDEDTMQDFVRRFQPDTEEWQRFASIAEDFGYCL